MSKVTIRAGRASSGRSGGQWKTMHTSDARDLDCSLPEADNQFYVAAKYAETHLISTAVIFAANDTDIIVAAVARIPIKTNCKDFSMTSTASPGTRMVDVAKVRTKLLKSFPEELRAHVLPALLGFYVITWSNFAGAPTQKREGFL